MAIEEITIAQGAQWRIGEVRIGIVRVGTYEDSDAVELLLRTPSETGHALVTVAGREAEFSGWVISLLWTGRSADRAVRETVRLRARRAEGSGLE